MFLIVCRAIMQCADEISIVNIVMGHNILLPNEITHSHQEFLLQIALEFKMVKSGVMDMLF